MHKSEIWKMLIETVLLTNLFFFLQMSGNTIQNVVKVSTVEDQSKELRQFTI